MASAPVATNGASLASPGERLVAGLKPEELKAQFDALDLASEKLDWILARWCVSRHSQIMLWEGDKELLSAPPWNPARNIGQMRYYMRRLELEGWKSSFRGRIIVQPKSAEPKKDLNLLERWATAGMTLIGAAYMLKKTKPSCKTVLALKETGIEDVIDMSINTPHFANAWLKHQANMHHEGIPYSPAESLYESQEGEREWRKYKIENNIRVSNCPPSGPMSYAKQKNVFVLQV